MCPLRLDEITLYHLGAFIRRAVALECTGRRYRREGIESPFMIRHHRIATSKMERRNVENIIGREPRSVNMYQWMRGDGAVRGRRATHLCTMAVGSGRSAYDLAEDDDS